MATQLRGMLLGREERAPRGGPVAKVTWATGGVKVKDVHPGNVPAALASAMPGQHDEGKERAVHAEVRAGRRLEATRVTSRQWSQLSSSVEFGGCREVVFSAARETIRVREVLEAQGCSVRRYVPQQAWDAARPSFYQQLAQDRHSLDAVVLGMGDGALDLALPAAAENAAAGVFARVPWEYVAGADEARYEWLRAAQQRERLAMLEWEDDDGSKGFWLCVFNSRETRDVMLVDRRSAVTLV